ncbi:MAG: nucleotidyl transferase AbiEii/AbiGii toxin family protein [Chloroflexi bacterium]|nr:nucleotidyl transferase AbiEii/AbiGii toxin family protein [Chloroflexota bacterium]
MLEPTARQVRNWGDRLGIARLDDAEHDLRLSHFLASIAESALSGRLCLKGGTALNRLYFRERARRSIDLDFNVLGPGRTAFDLQTEIRAAVAVLARQVGLEPSEPRPNTRGDVLSFRYRPASYMDAQSRPLKVELSFVEPFSVLGSVERTMTAL